MMRRLSAAHHSLRDGIDGILPFFGSAFRAVITLSAEQRNKPSKSSRLHASH
jgi:hypothetical protein